MPMCFYNVGIQNNEVHGRNSHAKCRKLQSDIEKIFDPNRGVQALFLSEFGNMFKNIDIDLTRALFQHIVKKSRPSIRSPRRA